MIAAKPGDRVLLLSPPAVEDVRAIAGALEGGVLVCVAPERRISELRRGIADVANAMVVPADETGMLPWNDEFFSMVSAPDLTEPTSEVLRVVRPGGEILLAGGVVVKR